MTNTIENRLKRIEDDIQVIKIDLKNCATKDDLKKFATKDELKKFATKDDLKNFATKKDLEIYSTKDDLKELTKLMMEGFDRIDDRFDQLIAKNTSLAGFV